VAGALQLANANWKNLEVFEFHCLKIEEGYIQNVNIPQLLNFPLLEILKFCIQIFI